MLLQRKLINFLVGVVLFKRFLYHISVVINISVSTKTIFTIIYTLLATNLYILSFNEFL